MPTIINQVEIHIEWTDLLSWKHCPQPFTAQIRTPGIHLSGVIRAVMQTLGKLDATERDEIMPIRMALGMAWENWVVGLIGARTVEDGGLPVEEGGWVINWQPGEWEQDEVYGTPDGVGLVMVQGEDGELEEMACLDEFKATWKSVHTRQDILRETLWMWQLAGNCYALGLTVARLHVFWVNGDYRPPSPKYVVYTIRFEEEELESLWKNVILKNKMLAVAE